MRKDYRKIIEDIQVASFQCCLGKGEGITDKQFDYLIKGLVQDCILLLLIEDAVKDFEKEKDLSSALEKVGITKKGRYLHSRALGTKLFNIEIEVNFSADVMDDYVPDSIIKHDKKLRKLKSNQELVKQEGLVAKNFDSKFIQKICLLCMRSIAEQESISPGEVISIENMCRVWKIKHSEVMEWYADLYELIFACLDGFGSLNVTPFMPEFFDISEGGEIMTVFYNLDISETEKLKKLCSKTIDENMDFSESIEYIKKNCHKATTKNLHIGNHPTDLNGSRFIFE